jgi:elongation factor P
MLINLSRASSQHLDRLKHVSFLKCSISRRTMAKISASDLKTGDVIEHTDGNIYSIEEQRIARMGMGRAYKQIVLRGVKSGIKKDVRFRVDEDIEQVALDRPVSMQVLYIDGDVLALMNRTTFEQVEVPLQLLGQQAPYVQEGLTVSLQTYQGSPASVTLPPKVTLEVKEVTALPSGSAKENRDITCLTTSGLRLKVPKFTKAGDHILVDTRLETLGEYIGKAKDENLN